MTTNHTNGKNRQKSKDNSGQESQSDVTDYSTTDFDKQKKARRQTIAIVIAIVLIAGATVFLLVKPLASKWNEDVQGKIDPPGESSQPFNRPSLSTNPPTAQPDDDSSESGSANQTRRAQTAESLNLPATQVGDWTDVVNPVDRVTNNQKMVDRISQLISSARAELQGIPVNPSDPDPRLQDIANFYLYGNQQAVQGLVGANEGKYTETGDSLTVFDTARDGIYSFTYYLPSAQGGNGFLMAGWYDPVSDSLKVETASQTR